MRVKKGYIIRHSYRRSIMNHFLNTDYYSREEAYQMTMHYVRKMRDKALISQQEYDAIDTIMRQKYRPIFVTFMEQI